MAAALAEGVSVIQNVLMSQDIAATCEAMRVLGAAVDTQAEAGGTVTLTITGNPAPQAQGKTFDCSESGSTLRFLLPVLALAARDTTVQGRGRLAERPLGPYFDIFKEQGVAWHCGCPGKTLPLTLSGSLKAGRYALPGNVSSQFITGLLFALPLLDGDSEIAVTTPLESASYVAITLKVLADFGIAVDASADLRSFRVAGGQQYKPCSQRVEGDYSQAAFWLVAGAAGKGMECLDLKDNSAQGDRAIVEILRAMGARIDTLLDGLRIHAGPLQGRTIDVSDCPDLVPVLAVAGALAQGETRIVGAARLRYKESDRLAAMTAVLTALGVGVMEEEDGLIITGADSFSGGQADSYNDHRIAMAAAVASAACRDALILTGPDCVRKSYPDFWQDFEKLGGHYHGIDVG
jgi:3-phosphoshikimate 1-carboxyvinyltransferase